MLKRLLIQVLSKHSKLTIAQLAKTFFLNIKENNGMSIPASLDMNAIEEIFLKKIFLKEFNEFRYKIIQ